MQRISRKCNESSGINEVSSLAKRIDDKERVEGVYDIYLMSVYRKAVKSLLINQASPHEKEREA